MQSILAAYQQAIAKDIAANPDYDPDAEDPRAFVSDELVTPINVSFPEVASFLKKHFDADADETSESGVIDWSVIKQNVITLRADNPGLGDPE